MAAIATLRLDIQPSILPYVGCRIVGRSKPFRSWSYLKRRRGGRIIRHTWRKHFWADRTPNRPTEERTDPHTLSSPLFIVTEIGRSSPPRQNRNGIRRGEQGKVTRVRKRKSWWPKYFERCHEVDRSPPSDRSNAYHHFLQCVLLRNLVNINFPS